MRRRRGLKVNAGKSRVVILNGEEGLECEIYVDGIRLEFKYLGCVLEESGTDGAECSRKVASGRMVQVPSGPWIMIGICILSVLEYFMRHCLCLFLYMAMRQCYGRRRRDLE